MMVHDSDTAPISIPIENVAITALSPELIASRPAGVWRQSWHRFRRNRAGMIGMVLVLLVLFVALTCSFTAPYGPTDQSALFSYGIDKPPTWAFLLGTDRSGYDVLSRVMYGAGPALSVGIGAMILASFIGITIGGISGYLGGFTDELLMRFTELFLVVPIFVVLLAAVRLFGIVVVGTWVANIPHLNLMTIAFLLGLFAWPPIARVARAEFLRLKSAEFVEAAICIGATRRGIVIGHILPNALPPLIVIIALGIGSAILTEAMVSFLGFGDPSSVSWGQMLYLNYGVLRIAPWASIAPGTAIFITVLGFNLLADGLSDAFNPRQRH